MPFLNVVLTSWISTRITIVGPTRFSCCADGNSTRKILFSWPKKFCNSKSGVLLGWWVCWSTSWVCWRRDVQRLHIWREGKTHSNKRWILTVLRLLDKVSVSGDTQFHLQPPILLTSDSTPFLTSHLIADSLPNPIIIQLQCLCPLPLWHYLHLHFLYFYVLTPLHHCPLPWIIPDLSDLSATLMFILFSLFLLWQTYKPCLHFLHITPL